MALPSYQEVMAGGDMTADPGYSNLPSYLENRPATPNDPVDVMPQEENVARGGGYENVPSYLAETPIREKLPSYDEVMGKLPSYDEVMKTPWYEKAGKELNKGNYVEALNVADEAARKGVRRSLGLPVDRAPTWEEIKDSLGDIYTGLTEPAGGESKKLPNTVLNAPVNAAISAYDFMRSPAGPMTLGIGFLGNTAQALIGAGFTSQMLNSTIEAAKEGRWGDAAQNLIMAVGGAHGTRESVKMKAEPSVIPPEEAATAKFRFPQELPAETAARLDATNVKLAARSAHMQILQPDLTRTIVETNRGNLGKLPPTPAGPADLAAKWTAETTSETPAKSAVDIAMETSPQALAPAVTPEQRAAESAQIAADQKAAAEQAAATAPAPQPVSPAKLTDTVQSDPNYVYHATNSERLKDIADSGKLDVHAPDYGTDQSEWPDGSTKPRAYFSGKANIVWSFAPEEGQPVIIRTRTAPNLKTESTGDIYSSTPIESKHLEYLGEDNNWHPVDNLAEKTKAAAEPAKPAKPAEQPAAASQPAATAASPTFTGTQAFNEEQLAARSLPLDKLLSNRNWQAAWDSAKQREVATPGANERLAGSILKDPRAPSDQVEQAQLIQNEIAAHEELQRASAAKDLAPKDDPIAAQRLSDALQRFQDAHNANHQTGTVAGATFGIRRLLADQFYSIQKMNAVRNAIRNKAMGAKELAQTKQLFNDLKAAKDRMDNLDKQRGVDDTYTHVTTKVLKDVGDAAPKGKQAVRDFMNAQKDAALKRIVARRGQLNINVLGFNPAALADEIIVGAAHITNGLGRFTDWSKQMLTDFGERVRPFLKDIYDRSKAMNDSVDQHARNVRGLKAYKTRLKNLTEAKQAKIEDVQKAQAVMRDPKATAAEKQLADQTIKINLQRATKRPLPLDREALQAQQDYKDLTDKWNNILEKDRLSNRPPWQKLLDTFVSGTRAEKLTGIPTYGKIVGAAATRVAFQTPAEQLAGGLLQRLPVLKQVFEAAPREKLNLRAELAGLKGIGVGIKEIPGVLTGRIGTHETRIAGPRAFEIPGRTHAAGKRFAWRNEYERSMVAFADHAQKQGKDVNDPFVRQSIEEASRAEANRAISMNDNLLSSAFNQLTHGWEGSKSHPISGFLAAKLARFLLPIVRVPTNIGIEAGGMSLSGLPNMLAATGKLVGVMKRGMENIKPEEAAFIARNYKKGMVGAALFWTGYFGADHFGGFYQQKKKGEEDDPNAPRWGEAQFGDVRIPKWLLHSPAFIVLQAGATMRHLIDKGSGRPAAAWESVRGIAEEIPFVRETNAIDSILGESYGSRGSKFLGDMLRGTAVPQGLQNVASFTDEKDEQGYPIKRYPRTAFDYFKMGVPGLREQVPDQPKTRESGKPQSPATQLRNLRRKQLKAMLGNQNEE